jgi:type I restriction enzyme S subunit
MVRVEDIKLLDGWKRYTLQEMLDAEIVISHLDGNHGELYPNKDEFVESGVPYLSANCVVDDEIDFTKSKFLTQKRANTFKKGVAINDDVLFAHNATVGPVAILKTNLDFVVLSTTLTYYRCNKKFLLPNYLRLYMISDFFVNQYSEVMRQATRNQVPITKQRTFFHLVPPLPEQQRIVSILDECFAAIDKAKANAEQNLKNAAALFESYLQGVFENGNWETKKLNEITEVKDGTHDSPGYIKEGIPFVTQKNIRPDGLSFEDTKFITGADHEKFFKRSNVTYGDILISMIGANRGMAAIVDDKRVFSIKNVGLIKSSNNINMNFLLYYLKSPDAMKYVLYMSNGGAQEFVGLTALRSFPVPLPSLEEQQTIVLQLDALRAETQKLEAIYQQKLLNLEELKKSVLQKAFAGELTTEKE